MKTWKLYGTGLVTLATLAPGLRAQVPGGAAATPAAAAAPVPATAAAATTAAPAAGGLTGCIKDLKSACELIQQCFCETQLGQLLNGMITPAAAFSGGVIPQLCPVNKVYAEDLAAGGATGAAAKIKQDEADAKKRREAVRYLGTVDCHWWPEAEAGLIAALRADRNECVRLEAAIALGRGCCCTVRTLKALTLTVTGSEEDGNPSENSERVKWAAQAALDGCLARFPVEAPTPELLPPPVEPQKEKKLEREKEPAPSPPDQAASCFPPYYRKLHARHLPRVLEAARKAVGEHTVSAAISPVRRPGGGNLYAIVTHAFGPQKTRTGLPAADPALVLATDPPRPATPAPAGGAKAVTVRQAVHAAPQPAAPQALPLSARPSKVSTTHTIKALQECDLADQREWAACSLAELDWRANPEIVPALLRSACSDPAPSVRATCARCLGEMQVNTAPVLHALQMLLSDADPRVQHEARTAITRLFPAASGSR